MEGGAMIATVKWMGSGEPTSIDSLKGCVGPGWHGILERLVADLFALGWDGVVAQVKEKFGGLCFYIGGGSDAIFDRIDLATDESYRTCEDCGEPGHARDTGWVRTRCDRCAEGKP
jgi:hypothetical protein